MQNLQQGFIITLVKSSNAPHAHFLYIQHTLLRKMAHRFYGLKGQLDFYITLGQWAY